MQMSVRSSVRLMKSVLELTIFIFLYQVSLRSVSDLSSRSLCAYFVRQTEPKILRLVLNSFSILPKNLNFNFL